MTISTTTAGTRGGTAVRVGAYVLLAYTVSWICWLPLAFSHQIVHVGGWPSHLPGLLGPAVAAVVVTCWVTGRAGIRNLLSRLTRWQIGCWWLVALSPLALLGLRRAGAAAAGQNLPRWADFGRINGFIAEASLIVADVATHNRVLAPAAVRRLSGDPVDTGMHWSAK